MAKEEWESWYSGGGDDYSDYYIEDQQPSPDLVDVLGWGNTNEFMDQHAQDLAWDAVVGGNDSAKAELIEYLWDEYGIDFEQEFDWQDFREWYDAS